MAYIRGQDSAEQKKTNAQSVLVLVFAALASAMLLFSPFGPISNSLIPFHTMGWAGIFVFLAMVTCYSQRYQESKDNFWFILALMFFPVLILIYTSFQYQKLWVLAWHGGWGFRLPFALSASHS